MSNKAIVIYPNEFGYCSVGAVPANHKGTLEEWKDKMTPTGQTSYIIPTEDVPTDDTFFDAWKFESNKIMTDMTKAKELHKQKIREARETKLAELDIEFQKAQETSADTSTIVSKKQALRDAPADSAINAASDEAALKSQWNTSILGPSPYSS
tara:strand:- start:227 stop:685 length:459 start_codon:yes stop_codon:yes gene_type:complete